MIGSVPPDTRYTPLTQQPYCCVPTCVQIVLLKNGLPLPPAEFLGYEMGLVVPKSEKHLFWNARVGSRPPAGYGTQANKVEYGPNRVFKKLNIPLKTSWSLINKFKNIELFKKYLLEVENCNKDVLVCFDWPTLFNKTKKGHWGHVCVLDKVYLGDNKVRLIDPETNAPKWREVTITDLYQAMIVHGSKNNGGFWEFTRLLR